MTPPTRLTAVLLFLGVSSLVTGRALAWSLRLRRWRLPTPESAAGAAVLGAMAWTVGFGLLNGPARLSGRQGAVLLGLALPVVGAVAWRRRVRSRARSRRDRRAWLAFLGAMGITSVLALAPVWAREGFLAGNDTYTYCALGEWLQSHAFGRPEQRQLDDPVGAIASQQQERGFPLGAAYPLALARAAGLGGTTLGLYPAVSGLGLVLSLCALWCASRFVLRAPPSVTAAIALAFATVPHAGYWAHHNGFLSQTLAVPGLLLGLASIAAGRGLRDRSNLVTLTFSAAFLCYVYLPFVPLLGVAAAAGLPGALGRDPGRYRSLARRLAPAALLFVLLVGVDARWLGRGLVVLLGSTKVGAHVALSPLGMAAVAVGFGPGAVTNVPRGPSAGAPWVPVLTCVAVLLAGMGVRAHWRDRRARGLLVGLGLLAALGAWNAFVSADPWTSSRGHTWRLFKLAQWAFPLLLLLQAGGLAWLWRRAKGAEAAFLAATLTLAPFQLPWAVDLGGGLAGIVDGERPLRLVDRLHGRLEGLPPGQLLLLGQPAARSPFRGGYAALLAQPRMVVGDWEMSASIPLDLAKSRELYETLVHRIGEPGIVAVLLDAPAFDAADREDLGGGFAHLVGLDRPRLVQVAPRMTSPGPPGHPVSGLAGPRTKLLVLRAREAPLVFSLQVRPTLIEASQVDLRVVRGTLGGTAFRRRVREAPVESVSLHQGRVRLQIEAARGLTTLVLSADDRAVSVETLELYSTDP
jgi:hypothetical protein